MKKKIISGLVIIFVAIQFIPVDLNQSSETPKTDFILVENPPEQVGKILKTSCYDCHSNNTTYPWFDKIKPITFWVNSHIEEGKEHLNFSEWGLYPEDRKEHKLEEMIEEVEENEMPLKSYLLTHSEAKVSPSDFKVLEEWVTSR